MSSSKPSLSLPLGSRFRCPIPQRTHRALIADERCTNPLTASRKRLLWNEIRHAKPAAPQTHKCPASVSRSWGLHSFDSYRDPATGCVGILGSGLQASSTGILNGLVPQHLPARIFRIRQSLSLPPPQRIPGIRVTNICTLLHSLVTSCVSRLAETRGYGTTGQA